MKGRQQGASSVAGVVSGLPEAFISPAASLLDMRDGRPVAVGGVGELALCQAGGLAEGRQTFAQGAAQSSDSSRLSRHVLHASASRGCYRP
jgi:hypothetical protein